MHMRALSHKVHLPDAKEQAQKSTSKLRRCDSDLYRLLQHTHCVFVSGVVCKGHTHKHTKHMKSRWYRQCFMIATTQRLSQHSNPPDQPTSWALKVISVIFLRCTEDDADESCSDENSAQSLTDVPPGMLSSNSSCATSDYVRAHEGALSEATAQASAWTVMLACYSLSKRCSHSLGLVDRNAIAPAVYQSGSTNELFSRMIVQSRPGFASAWVLMCSWGTLESQDGTLNLGAV